MASLDLWYLDDRARFLEEFAALTALTTQVQWLTIGATRFDGKGRLVVDCDIDIGHRVYEACLRYPALYPTSPPTIYPRDGASRWSVHQYGDGGDLCLEYRSDNWSREVVGAQMLESAYRLLHGENPAAQEQARVPSAHLTTVGQSLRGTFQRLVLTRWSQAQLSALAPGATANGRYRFLSINASNANQVLSTLTLGMNEPLDDPDAPTKALNGYSDHPAVIRSLASDDPLPSTDSREAFVESLNALGMSPDEALFVFVRGNVFHAAILYDTFVAAVGVVVPPTSHDRLGADHARLGQQKIAIIGCGSLGSKVATTLARSGCGSFVLVDDEILLPDNLIRHDLDWREAGMHKVDALGRRLQLVAPAVEVNSRATRLGGQISATAAEGLLNVLAGCDVIVDATANPEVGLILSDFPKRTGVPVVWGEVFAGGVGGLIARARPESEPSITLMRRAIDNWFADNDPSQPHRGDPVAPYADRGEQPLVADDSDVSCIASGVSRLAMDTLLDRNPSAFTHAAYVIGMAPDGLFSGAFDTHPIAFPPPPPEQESEPLTATQEVEAAERLQIIVANTVRSS